jgi:hypothetical protein
MSSLLTPDPGTVESVIENCVATLRRVAEYRLPPALDERLLWLSENKESLTQAERQELLALVEFADEKTAEKLQAQAALRRIDQVFPKLASAAS